MKIWFLSFRLRSLFCTFYFIPICMFNFCKKLYFLLRSRKIVLIQLIIFCLQSLENMLFPNSRQGSIRNIRVNRSEMRMGGGSLNYLGNLTLPIRPWEPNHPVNAPAKNSLAPARQSCYTPNISNSMDTPGQAILHTSLASNLSISSKLSPGPAKQKDL